MNCDSSPFYVGRVASMWLPVHALGMAVCLLASSPGSLAAASGANRAGSSQPSIRRAQVSQPSSRRAQVKNAPVEAPKEGGGDPDPLPEGAVTLRLSAPGAVVIRAGAGTTTIGLGLHVQFTERMLVQAQVGTVSGEEGFQAGADAVMLLAEPQRIGRYNVQGYGGGGASFGTAVRPEASVSVQFYSAVAGIWYENPTGKIPLDFYLQTRAGLMTAMRPGAVPVFQPGAGLELGLMLRVK